jgi:hypothetical protein
MEVGSQKSEVKKKIKKLKGAGHCPNSHWGSKSVLFQKALIFAARLQPTELNKTKNQKS